MCLTPREQRIRANPSTAISADQKSWYIIHSNCICANFSMISKKSCIKRVSLRSDVVLSSELRMLQRTPISNERLVLLAFAMHLTLWSTIGGTVSQTSFNGMMLHILSTTSMILVYAESSTVLNTSFTGPSYMLHSIMTLRMPRFSQSLLQMTHLATSRTICLCTQRQVQRWVLQNQSPNMRGAVTRRLNWQSFALKLPCEVPWLLMAFSTIGGWLSPT